MRVVEPFVMKAWSVFEMFRRMGFPSDAIFFVTTNDLDIGIELRWGGEATIRVCGKADHGLSSRDEIEKRWLDFIHEDVATLPEETFRAAWEGSSAQSLGGAIFLQLAMRGIHPPRTT